VRHCGKHLAKDDSRALTRKGDDMKVINDSSPNTLKKVSFKRTLYTGRRIEQWVEANTDEGPSINIEGTNLQLQDIDEFIGAIKLAAMIASGELEII
jgi:hypothetical protein